MNFYHSLFNLKLAMSWKTIKGIDFTPREIDIIACIVSGRPSREIPSILSIALRTVSTHIARIRGKMRASSITTFIENTGKAGIIKHMYYPALMAQNYFEHSLKKLPKRNDDKITTIYLIISQNNLEGHRFFPIMEKHFNLLGLKTKILSEEAIQVDSALEKVKSETINQLTCVFNDIYPVWLDIAFKDSTLLIFLQETEAGKISRQDSKYETILLSGNTHYYKILSHILSKLYPLKIMEDLLKDILIYYESINSPYKSEANENILDNTDQEFRVERKNSFYGKLNLNRWPIVLFAMVASFICIGTSIFLFKSPSPELIARSNLTLRRRQLNLNILEYAPLGKI